MSFFSKRYLTRKTTKQEQKINTSHSKWSKLYRALKKCQDMFYIKSRPKDVIYRIQKVKNAKRFLNVWTIHEKSNGQQYEIKENLMKRDEYVSPKSKLDEFSEIDKYKIKVNYEFVKYLNSLDPLKKDNILYLDSDSCLTTMALASAGYKKNQLFSPNINENFHPIDLFQDMCQFSQGTIFEWVRDNHHDTKKKYHFGLDYCCTIVGNSTYVKPLSDLTLIFFHRLLPEKNGLIWLTFSLRLTKKEKLNYFIDEMKSLAKSFQYHLNVLHIGYYKKIVYLFLQTK